MKELCKEVAKKYIEYYGEHLLIEAENMKEAFPISPEISTPVDNIPENISTGTIEQYAWELRDSLTFIQLEDAAYKRLVFRNGYKLYKFEDIKGIFVEGININIELDSDYPIVFKRHSQITLGEYKTLIFVGKFEKVPKTIKIKDIPLYYDIYKECYYPTTGERGYFKLTQIE